MTDALFHYPHQARVGRVVPKNKIYEHGPVTAAVRERFVKQLEQITWQYKLAPETINLPAKPGVPEIQIFDMALKTDELDERVLHAVDRAIPLPIVFQLHHGARIRMVAAHKRPSETGAGPWVIGSYFWGGWHADGTERVPLPIALDLASLYEQLLRSLLPHPPRPGEGLTEQLERLTQLRRLQSECLKLTARMHQEQQFNRKVETNAQLRALQADIDQLSA